MLLLLCRHHNHKLRSCDDGLATSDQEKGTKKQFNINITLDSKAQIELPIVCMISTAEPTAFFTSWISAWK
jgi:hypothetical protein